MRETTLSGAFFVDVQPARDARGLFARTFDRETFTAYGMAVDIDQVSVSYNERAGTLRGMHYQAAPHGEEKLVRCVRGTIHDVIVDLRPDSATFRKWFGVDLDQDSRTALYIPKGMAHGFLTLTHAAEVLYLISTPYVPDAGRGVRWDDPAFDIDWPGIPQVMSDRDRTYPDFQP